MASLKQLLFKPRWQHRSPTVRARAVAEDQDPRMLEQLASIAREDSAPEVRLAAIRRSRDLLVLMRAAADDDNAEVRTTAYRAYRLLLSGEDTAAPPLPERIEIVPRLEDEALIQYLAKHGTDEALREAAIAKIDKPGLLGDLALAESSRKLRLAIIERLDQIPTLERIASATRTNDKRAYRAAQQRVIALGGESEVLTEADALELCVAVEDLARSGAPREQKAKQLGEIKERWLKLSDEARARHQTRFDGGFNIADRLINPPAAPTKTPAQKALQVELEGALSDAQALDESAELSSVQGLIDRLQALMQPIEADGDPADAERVHAASSRLAELQDTLLEAQPVDKALMRLADDAERLRAGRVSLSKLDQLEERWSAAWQGRRASRHDEGVDARFRERIGALRRDCEAIDEKRTAALAQIDQQMDQLDHALESGSLSDSVVAKQRVLDTLKTIGRHPSVEAVEFTGRLASARGKLQELRDWQHWANDKIRQSLCEEAEGLVGSGMHPDAVTEKIKQLRAQWKSMDEGERLPGDRPKRVPSPKLFRRFQSACNEAFTPAKGFFEKRAELRNKHFDELDQLAKRLEAVGSDSQARDVGELERLVRQGRRSMRELNQIPPKARSKMAQRLREGANVLDGRLDELYAVVERKKQRIIDEVAALDPADDLEGAISAAKDAQRRWRDAGRTRRKRDQALWKAFRAASDQIFDHQRQKSEAARAVEAEQLEALDAILTALEASVAEAEAAPDEASATLRRLGDEWRAIGLRQRGRDRRFEDLRGAVEQAIGASRRDAAKALRKQELAFTALCLAAEARWFDDQQPSIDELSKEAAASIDQMPLRLRERWQRAQDAAPQDLDALSQAAAKNAEAVCVALEFLAGVETPDRYRQARMDYQVARLSARMSGESMPSPTQEASELIERWADAGPLHPDVASTCSDRIEKAFDALGDL